MKLSLFLVLAACGAASDSKVAAPGAAGAPLGVQTLEARDPITAAPLALAVLYPAATAGPPTTYGLYAVAATRDAPIAAGRFPLVVISHGHGGALWGHHDLAEALGRAGYVVALVEHNGDSWRDQTGFRSDRVMYGRAYQVTATIDRVLAEPRIAAHVDAGRIGVAGFSAGGYTSLTAVGAEPDFGRVPAYCGRHPEDTEVCSAPLRNELTAAQKRPMRDPRIRAAFVMAPFALAFGPESFRAVRVPIFLAWGSRDEVLLPDENARAIAPALPTLVGTREVPGARHYTFLPPCEPALAQRIPTLCSDPPGIDRAAIHAQLAADAIRFFAAALAPQR